MKENRLIYMLLHRFRQYRPDKQVLLLVAICTVVFVSTAFYYVYSSPPTGDEPHFLVISQTLLKYHSLNVMLDYTHGDYRTFYPTNLAPHVSYSASGQLLPLHSIGAPILWLIPYYFWGRLGAVLFISCIAVLIILNIYWLLLIMGISRKYALIVSLAYMLASPVYLYSHLTFIEPIGALLCIYVLRKVLQKEISTADILVSSLLLGILPWIHIRFALFEIVLFGAFLYKLYASNKFKNLKYYVYFLLPVVALFVLFEIYNLKVWGTLNPTINEVNDIHGNSKPFAALPFRAILGLLFDQEFGLFISFPVFIFLFMGIVLAMKKQFTRYNLLLLALSLPYLLICTTFRIWSGGWSPTARFLIVLLPLGSFYMAYALEQLRSILSSIVFALAMIFGCIYNLLALVPSLNSFNDGRGRNRALMQLWLFHHRVTDFLPSMFLSGQNRLFVLWISAYVVLAVLMLYAAKAKAIHLSWSKICLRGWRAR